MTSQKIDGGYIMFTMTATEQALAIKERRIGVEELTRGYLDRIDKYDGLNGLNSVAELNESCIAQAKEMDSLNTDRSGAMFGLPILVKDNIDVVGLHTTAGSLALADNIAKSDATVIKNLRKNGALILGKTNMTEFANYTGHNMPGGYSSRGGQVKHAFDIKKNPSGSSTGSAVAVSAGLCSAAIGTDTSFSIIGCVTENGVTGLKPAHGSLSCEGIIPISKQLDSAGPITRDLTDALLVYSCMRGEALPKIEPMESKNVRLAVNYFNRFMVSKDQLERYDKLFCVLKQNGFQIEKVMHKYTKYQSEMMRLDFRNDLEEYLVNSNASKKTLKEIVDFYEENPEKMMKYGDHYLRSSLEAGFTKQDKVIYKKVLKTRELLRAKILKSLEKFDACVLTGPTNIMHFIGIPSLALRFCMAKDETTKGIILYGADEQRLFSAALTIEQYCNSVR